jgi:hypothetical protein
MYQEDTKSFIFLLTGSVAHPTHARSATIEVPPCGPLRPARMRRHALPRTIISRDAIACLVGNLAA